MNDSKVKPEKSICAFVFCENLRSNACSKYVDLNQCPMASLGLVHDKQIFTNESNFESEYLTKIYKVVYKYQVKNN